ncbi:MAG: hypothetical protein QOD06_2050 [Candidatus Binatota bacterium]|jgi:hypothetical protein|nr:hypothetical protein [Candidatus Binatota bacterium]
MREAFLKIRQQGSPAALARAPNGDGTLDKEGVMKRLGLAIVVVIVCWLGAADVYAQCCDRQCQGAQTCRPGQVHENSVRCRAVSNDGTMDGIGVEPNAALVAGCVEQADSCVGGRAGYLNPVPIEGCACVGGQCTTGSTPNGNYAACTASAIRACANGAGTVMQVDDPACPACPEPTPTPAP